MGQKEPDGCKNGIAQTEGHHCLKKLGDDEAVTERMTEKFTGRQNPGIKDTDAIGDQKRVKKINDSGDDNIVIHDKSLLF